MTMTPRERWQATLRRQKPDRIPMDYWGTAEATHKLVRQLGCADEREMFARLRIDRVLTVEPPYVGPPRAPGYDIWKCRTEKVDYGGGSYDECIEHPLAAYTTVDEIERDYIWPTADWFDFSTLQDQIKGKEEYPVQGGGSEPFLIYKNMRGEAQAFIDLAENPEIVSYCLDKLFDFAYEYTARIYEQLPGKIDLSYVAEDFGGQDHLMFSPRLIRSVFIPRMARMIDLAHQAGVFVFHHSDGAIRDIVPDMIGAGIDILNPIQWRCNGMDRASLKRDFGAEVVFHGGVDNQHTLPFGSVEDVRREVVENIRVLGAGGGYILAPCHNIQVITPVENVVALYETGYEYGKL